MKNLLVVFLAILLNFSVFGQGRINLDMSYGMSEMVFRGMNGLTVSKENHSSDIGNVISISASAFISDMLYVKTEYGFIETEQIIDVDFAGDVSASLGVINETDWLRFSQQYLTLIFGVQDNKTNIFGEMGLGTNINSNVEFNAHGDPIFQNNYAHLMFNLGWAKGLFGPKKSLGVLVFGKYLRTVGSLNLVPELHIQNDLISLNIGLRYILI